MSSRKSIGPRMDPWGIPALTGYSYTDFSSITTHSHLLLIKDKLNPNTQPEIPQDLSLWRRPACHILSKALNISSATALAAPNLLQTLTILWDTTIRRSTVYQDDLKPYWKSKQRPHFFRWSTNLSFKSSYKDFTIHGKKTNWAVISSCRHLIFLNTRTTDQAFKQSRDLPSNTYWRVHLVCIKVQVHLRTTMGIQSGPDVFDKSRLDMTFFLTAIWLPHSQTMGHSQEDNFINLTRS